MSATNPTYLISYDLLIEVNQADYELLSRIFETVTINGDCWEAAGPRNSTSRYVRLSRCSNPYQIGYVHRFVCHLYHGLPLNHRTHECHHLCGNRVCCRPSHLVPLSIAEHHSATHAAGQYLSGDQVSWSVLTEAQVVAYRARYAAGETCPALAEEAGVTRVTLWYALMGRAYRHVPGAVTNIHYRRDDRGSKHTKAVLTERLIRPIYYAFWGGYLDSVQLAKRYGVDDETIRGVVHNVTWTHVPRPVVRIGRVKIGPRHYRVIKRKGA